MAAQEVNASLHNEGYVIASNARELYERAEFAYDSLIRPDTPVRGTVLEILDTSNDLITFVYEDLAGIQHTEKLNVMRPVRFKDQP
jgi:hypothetical protein